LRAGDEATREDQGGGALGDGGGSPVAKAGEFVAVLSRRDGEFFGVEMGGFLAQEGLNALEIGDCSRAEGIAWRHPVVSGASSWRDWYTGKVACVKTCKAEKKRI